MSNGAINLWVLGYPDQAHVRSLEGAALAEQLDPFSYAFGVWGRVRIAVMRGEFSGELEKAQAFYRYAKEQGSPLFSMVAGMVLGLNLIKAGMNNDGLDQIRQSLVIGEKISARGALMLGLCDLLWAYLATGNYHAGLRKVAREMEKHPFTGQRWMEPEVRRLYGELMLADDPSHAYEAEGEFKLAIEIAQKQHAKSLELRAATSLARLWQKQGKKQQAHQRLAEVYDWFTEGFETADLLEAKALLDELLN